jgi:hypothetical protein
MEYVRPRRNKARRWTGVNKVMQGARRKDSKITGVNTRQRTAIYQARANYHPQVVIMFFEISSCRRFS